MPSPASFCLFNTDLMQFKKVKFPWLDSNCRSLLSETNGLPTKQQPLPKRKSGKKLFLSRPPNFWTWVHSTTASVHSSNLKGKMVLQLYRFRFAIKKLLAPVKMAESARNQFGKTLFLMSNTLLPLFPSSNNFTELKKGGGHRHRS